MGSLYEGLCTLMIISSRIILIMGNVSYINCRKVRTHFICNNFSSENRVVYEIMWENIVEPCRLQMKIWSMLITRWIIKDTNTHSEYVKLIDFLRQQWFAKASQYFVISTKPFLLNRHNDGFMSCNIWTNSVHCYSSSTVSSMLPL
jgi:hypothetical protein